MSDTISMPFRQCRHGMMMVVPEAGEIGRSLEFYGEYGSAQMRLFEQIVEPGTCGRSFSPLSVPSNLKFARSVAGR